jgi:hypothetical protein
VKAHSCTRRQALLGAGAALFGIVLLGPRVAVAGEPNPAMALDPVRAATMTALIAALAVGPAAGVDPEAYAADFAAFYAASEPPFRGLADGALDRLTALTSMDPDAGLGALKAMAFDPARRLDVADGLTLAGLTFGDGERSRDGYFLATG